MINYCIIQNNLTTCHLSCKTCAVSSFCGDPNSCTSCFPDHYKISKNFDDTVFKCYEACDDFSFQLDDYWYCDKTSNMTLLDLPGTSENKFIMSEPSEIFFGFDILLCLSAIGFVCACGSIGCYYYFVYRKKQTSRYLQTNFANVEQALINLSKKPKTREKDFNFKNLKLISSIKDFKQNKFIGGGSYSRVYESIYKELQIYDTISHPNILPVLGVHLAVENMLFLALRKYNLRDYLKHFGKKAGFQQLKQYCIQIADALKYLHQKDILHCDLKINNILVKDDQGKEVEISDFGCAIDLKNDHELKFTGTVTHMSYELLKKSLNASFAASASKASDVWSYAVTVWQIFKKTEELPADFKTPKDIISNHENGKKLPTPDLMPELLWRHNILRCFDLDPNARPNMLELHKVLTTFQEESAISII